MKHLKNLASGRELRLPLRTVDLVRPGGEALLLAGVAFGCVQLGWSAVSPGGAERVSLALVSDNGAVAAERPLRSPFAPASQAEGVRAGAQPAAIAGIKVAGVRIADLAEQSGAIIGFPDGSQRPFLVGHEVVEGVVLSEVRGDRIVLAFDGGTQVLAVEPAAASGSFALALMGRSEYPAAELVLASNATATAGATATATATATTSKYSLPEASSAAQMNVRSDASTNAQWLMATMSHAEMRNGQVYAWRVATTPPKMATDAGLQVGDLIVAVNGNTPGDPAAVLAAASSGRISIAVERGSGERKVLTLSSGMPS
jgi:type II secretory pathway component PulC